MIDPLDFEKTPLLSILSRRRAATALMLWLESGSGALWRLFSWVAFFAGLWLLQIPSMLGKFGPGTAFAVFMTGTVYLLLRDARHLRAPQHDEIDRRLEKDSGLAHRPLSSIQDKLINPRQETTRHLWKKSQEDAFAALRGLRLPRLRPVLAQRDPWALRSAAILTLIVGIVVAGPQWHERISYGLFPFSLSGAAGEQVSPVTLWITPPAYTGLAQITMDGGERRGETLSIPEGSILKIRVSDGFIRPALRMGDSNLKLKKLGDKSWGIETAVIPGERLVLRQWPITRASITYKYIVDEPPTLTLDGDPEALTKGETRIPLKVEDDYGVTDLTINMDLDPMIEDRPLGSPYTETRAVMSPPGVEMQLKPVYDLSWHPWAGMPVVISLEADDHKGQKSTLPPILMTLPERKFTHPVAQKLVEMRHKLIWLPSESAEEVAQDIEDLMEDPAAFEYDKIVFLALSSARSRLFYSQNTDSVVHVIELLWDVALRIEDGNLPLAARSLQEAQRKLEQLLKDPNADAQEIAKAMTELREAMAAYFQELARELQKRMAENGQSMNIPPEMLQNAIRPDDLGSFLDKLQSEALTGDRKSAREMLSQLQQFMDMMDPSMDMAMPPQMQFMMDGVSQMQELVQKQQQLKDQTQEQIDKKTAAPPQEYPDAVPFDEQMQGVMKQWGLDQMPPQPQPDKKAGSGDAPAFDTQQNKVEQDSLRYVLGQLMMDADEQLGEIPEKMQKAEQEMRGSAESLGENDPAQSIPHQEATIEYLQDAMKDMAQQMQQMMKSMTMLSFGGGQFDPLGRPMQEGNGPGFFPGSKVKIPDEAERKRVQDILKILRQRSGEVNRPDYELDYYRRLMKQF